MRPRQAPVTTERGTSEMPVSDERKQKRVFARRRLSERWDGVVVSVWGMSSEVTKWLTVEQQFTVKSCNAYCPHSIHGVAVAQKHSHIK